MVGIDSCEDSNSDNDSSEDSYYDFKSAYTDVQRKCKAAKLRHEAEMESLTEDFNEQQAEVDKLCNEQFELVTRSTMVKKSKWPAINRELQVVQAAMGDGKKSLQYLTDCKRKSMEKYSRRVEELDTRKREIDEARAERRSERAFQEEDLGIDSTANRRVQLSEQNTRANTSNSENREIELTNLVAVERPIESASLVTVEVSGHTAQKGLI